MLVAVSVVAVLASDQIADAAEGRALLEVVRVGAPDFPIDKVFPFLACFAVANTALINMLMASRLLYGLANQDVLPRALGKVYPNRRAPYVGIVFSTVLALGLIIYVVRARPEDERHHSHLAGVTSLLLLGGVHGRQHGLPDPAARPADSGALQVARRHAGHRGRALRVPARAVGRPRGALIVPDRRRGCC